MSASKTTTFEAQPSITKNTANQAFRFISTAMPHTRKIVTTDPHVCADFVVVKLRCATTVKMAAKFACSCKKAESNTLLRKIQQGVLPENVEQSRKDVSLQPGCVYCAGSHGDAPLLVAARYGHLDIIKTLCEVYGAPLETANYDGKRPLHEAAQNGHAECARYLLTRGACVDALKIADWWVRVAYYISLHTTL